MQKSVFDYLIIMLKGMAMGAADVVPGVSGGTIAFISGIYDELLDSINAINFKLFKILRKEGFSAAWKYMNGNFLLALLTGIGISIVSLAKLLSQLLETDPILVWAFFFGLVLASIYYVGKQIAKWHFLRVLLLLLGAIIAFMITQIPSATSANPSAFYLILSGALAICAMILPGISGSFILVLLGVYQVVLTAVHQRQLGRIALVGFGAIIGLLSFSRLLKYIFLHYKNNTLAVLTGFLIGALYKIWPWKLALVIQEIGGKFVVVKEKNVSPFSYEGDNLLFYAIGLAVLGFMILIILEKWGTKLQK